jgi:glycosyltransferase involved in cell wall biosynthesis
MFPYALWRLRLVKQTPLILAPRGEFSPGALGLKRRVKQAYISVSRWFRTYQNGLLLWHASTALEAQDIRRVVMNDPSIAPPLGDTAPAVNRERGFGSAEIAVDLPGHARVPDSLKLKRPGELKAVFVSRVSRKKNLDYALRALKGIKGDVTFDICGPIEDAAFWDECKVLIGKLPPNTKVNYLGEVPHEDIARVFSEHDVFLFATRGENYGHVICEALTAGCPVVISDQTPWRNLQSLGVGWDLPLEDIGAFQSAIQQCIDMGTEEFAAFSQRTLAYGIERSTDKEAIEQNRRLFRRACEMANPAQRGNAPS